jgi:hypothetical protein
MPTFLLYVHLVRCIYIHHSGWFPRYISDDQEQFVDWNVYKEDFIGVVLTQMDTVSMQLSFLWVLKVVQLAKNLLCM